jgi:putative ABC transport system permease protein
MGTVIVLITVLVGLLSGLTAGLGRENTSAITALPADHLVFPEPAEGDAVAFSDAALPERTMREWAKVPGVRRAEPLGIATTKAEAGGRTAALSAFGVRPGSPLAPAEGAVGQGEAVLSEQAADALGVRAGGSLTLSGRQVRITAVSGRALYSHTPVIWTALGDGRKGADGPGAPVGATVLVLSTTGAADLAAADRALGTRTLLRRSAPTAPRTARCN